MLSETFVSVFPEVLKLPFVYRLNYETQIYVARKLKNVYVHKLKILQSLRSHMNGLKELREELKKNEASSLTLKSILLHSISSH